MEGLSIIIMDDGSLAYTSTTDQREPKNSNMFSSLDNRISIGEEILTVDENGEFEDDPFTGETPEPIVKTEESYINCMICRTEIRPLLDPWLDVGNCVSATSQTKMEDFVSDFLNPNRNLDCTVSLIF